MFYPLTTQQGVVAEPRETERSQRLVKFLVRTAFRGEPTCSGLPDRTSLRPVDLPYGRVDDEMLFRSSRPDFIETLAGKDDEYLEMRCSGLPDRTSLILESYGVAALRIVMAGAPPANKHPTA